MKSREQEPAGSKRASRRKTPPQQPTCVLSIGAQRLPAVIAEERGGTMHVMVQGSPQFWVEDSGQLTTPDAELSVRVFNIVRVEAAEDDPAGSIPAFRIGLERLGQVARETDPDDDLDEEDDDEVEVLTKKPKRFSLSGPLSLIAVVAILVSAAAAWQRHAGHIWAAPWGANSGGRKLLGSPSLPDSGTIESPSSHAPSGVSKLPGVEPFLQPEVVKKLDLTPAQTDACQRLNLTTQQAVEDLEKYWGSADRWELARKRDMLLLSARQEALELLTDPQRKLWDDMSR
jgi:hypothetical protein